MLELFRSWVTPVAVKSRVLRRSELFNTLDGLFMNTYVTNWYESRVCLWNGLPSNYFTYWLVQKTVNQVRKLTFIVNFSLLTAFSAAFLTFPTIDKYWGGWLSCRNRFNIRRYLRSVLALFVASTEFRHWINVLESQGGFLLSLFSRIRSCFTTKPPKRYIFHPCSSLFDYVDVAWVEAGCCKELRTENTRRHFGF